MSSVDSGTRQRLPRGRYWLFCGTLLLGGLGVLALALRPAAPRLTDRSSGIAVEGDARFVMRVGRALALLKQKDPPAHGLVVQHMARITQGQHSGMWAYLDPPTLEIGPATADSSTTWMASAIAHDAMHAKLYADWRAAHGMPVPDECWTGLEPERTCCGFQLEVLKQIGAPASEIEWCTRQDGGKYLDANGDGTLDWRDYQERKW